MKPLLPDRHPNQDFFICDVLDAVPKDDMASMEHPVFSLSTRPDTRLRTYHHNQTTIEIIPSEAGLATIHDKDILIYALSQVMAKRNAGLEPQKTLHLKAHDLLVATNRCTDGRGYKLLKDALTRLRGTTIVTNIKTGGEEITEGFGLIDSWRTIRHTTTGRMSEIKLELSDWMFNAILGNEVLTISRDYFRLRKPIERRVYEIARKHCGMQDSWAITLETLQIKCGTKGDRREFRRTLRELVRHAHLPDYHVALDDDVVTFSRRSNLLQEIGAGRGQHGLILSSDAHHQARNAAPGYDPYYLEQEWRNFWMDSGKPEIAHPDAAFVAFCERRYARCPKP